MTRLLLIILSPCKVLLWSSKSLNSVVMMVVDDNNDESAIAVFSDGL